MAYTGDEYAAKTPKGVSYAGLSQTQHESHKYIKKLARNLIISVEEIH